MNFQFKKIIKLLSLGIFLVNFLFAQNVGAATPTISNVSGTMAMGQTLTITGTNMVDEDKTDWALFYTTSAYGFEGGGVSPFADGYNGGNNDAVYDTAVKLMGVQSARFDLLDYIPNNLGKMNAVGLGISPATNVWIRLYVRYNVDIWPTGHTKMVMISPSAGYIQPAMNETNPPSQWYAQSGGSNNFLNPSGSLENDRWYCVEGHFDSINDLVTLYIDGQSVGSVAGDASMGSENAFSFGPINVDGGSVPINLHNWFDGLTASNSRVYPASIIEVSGDNGSTWRYQYPAYLSETSSTITADLPALSAPNYLLRVTNNKQEISSSFSLSGSNDTTPPVSPSGLVVL